MEGESCVELVISKIEFTKGLVGGWMALPKLVRQDGGSFYKGYILAVGAGLGDHVLDMTIAAKGCAVNGILITPDHAGAGDYFKLEHLNAGGLAFWDDGKAIKNSGIIAETIYNIGKYVSQKFDFVSLELFEPAHKLRLTYTNVAGVAMNVFVTVERVK